ncbi:sialate O-acetylesterase [Altererythrobacter sp.]|uniref:sialate O-acetylesterase n=1 Tax=Altererythrobacter sp. TaxID=1872480 RepID=UPI003D014D2C
MKLISAMILLSAPAIASAQTLELDAPFSSHAVLQRDRAIPISGQAAPGSAVTVSIGSESHTSKADQDGRWQIDLPARGAGGPFVIDVTSGDETLELSDILIGDVWLCSGQSNMEFTLRHATNSDFEVASSGNPNLRLLNVPRQSSPTPQDRFASPTQWQISGPDSAADFSAACFIMGRELQTHQKIPIGLIASSWGGSMIEDWISREALQTLPRYTTELALLDEYARDPQAAALQWTSVFRNGLGAKATAPADASWQTVPSHEVWESWGVSELAAFDGIGYYRASVTLSAAQAKQTANVSLGAIDDADFTRINGKDIGIVQGWNTERTYPVPAGTLKAGKNIIDVTVVDTGGGGGMWGDGQRKITLADGTTIPLENWSFAKGKPINQVGALPSAPWIGGSGRTTLYNGMIAPLHDYPVKGFAWYQGEANAGDAKGYATLMPLMIADWRKRFGADPFVMVQLANWGPLVSTPSDHGWAQLRDVQRQVADADPLVGMASAVDIGQVSDIHPTNKQDVGHRLALAARHLALGEDVEDRGPSPVAASRTTKGIEVRFAHGPLLVMGGSHAIGFELCNASAQCRFVPGEASGDTVTLPADPAAVEVRYLWQASPIVNLYNPAGLPASGFSMKIK